MRGEEALVEIERLQKRLTRERQARAAAENIAEAGMRQLYTRQQHLTLLQHITEAANSTSSFQEAVETVLRAVCQQATWDAGHVYLVDARPERVLASSGLWHVEPPHTFERLRAVSAAATFSPGEGLPGRVLDSGEAGWIIEIDEDANFPRRHEGNLDVRGALAFPVLVEKAVVAVFEFFSREPAALDMEFLALTRQMGLQLGRIFERASNERAMREATAAAEAGSRAKTEFLATVSHELRTPMNGIIGFTHLLLDTRLTAQQGDYANTIQRSAHALLGVINDVLDFSKLEADRLVPEEAPYDLHVVIADVAELLSPVAAQKQLELATLIEAGVPARLMGDAGRVRQVLINLVGNAVKFTDQGRVLIQATRTGATPDADHIRIAVTDTGPGIAENVQAGLFHRFIQADASTTRKHGGTGLGLAIAKGLIERMGGAIGLRSSVGHGSTFWVTLPVRLDHSDETPTATTTGAATVTAHGLAFSPTSAAEPPLRVLLAEDNIVNQRLAVLLLQRLSCVVDVANNGREAVQLFSSSSYDCVFMDCQMPELDGYGATQAIREMEADSHTPIVAVTANAMNGDRDRCLAAGMDGYITKPVRAGDLVRALAQWTGRVLTTSH